MIAAVRHETVGPPEARHRLRIAHLSDLHLWFSARKLPAIEQLVAAWAPDVLALTGDYADTPAGRRLATRWMQRLAESYPVCWIAGNHDRWGGGEFVASLERVPHAHAIDRGDAWIAGSGGGRFRFTTWSRAALGRADDSDSAATIALLHDPAELERESVAGGGARLLLAGHLHGGQIALWRDRAGRAQPAAMCYEWLVDRATIGPAVLIVSRGLGDTLPLRFRAPQEIVMIDLWA